MIDARVTPFALRLPSGLKWPLLGWIAAEVLAFLAVVHAIGLGGAILLGLATTVAGIMMLRRLGLEAARNLRQTVAGGMPGEGALLDGTLNALGGVLLIVPGFIANLAGLALAAPSVRRWTARRFGGAEGLVGAQRSRQARPDVIDLSPEDWRIVER